MSSESPAWLNAKFVQDVLRSSENDNSIEVKDAVMQRASAVGDNYSGEMIRANVEFSRKDSSPTKTEKKSLIMKLAPSTGDAKHIASELGLFTTEMRMMEKTLVQMNEMLKDEGCRLSAHALFTKTGDPTLIVMEDLMALGYKMADRLAGLDLEHSILVMRALARFHATSVALREKDPETMLEYDRNPLQTDMDQVTQLFKGSFKTLAKVLLDWPELGSSRQTYSEKLLKLAENYREMYIDCTKPKADEFTVLSHGDCWVNNMLFRYNDAGKVIDHIFVDFQISSLSSPALDILYFFNSSLAYDVEVHHRDELLEEYLSVLTKSMIKLQCTVKAPDMAELKRILRKYEFLEIMASCGTLPFVLADKSKVKTLNEILDEGEKFVSPGFESPEFRKKLIRRIPVWNAHGTLDF